MSASRLLGLQGPEQTQDSSSVSLVDNAQPGSICGVPTTLLYNARISNSLSLSNAYDKVYELGLKAMQKFKMMYHLLQGPF